MYIIHVTDGKRSAFVKKLSGGGSLLTQKPEEASRMHYRNAHMTVRFILREWDGRGFCEALKIS